ncbi:hypothetical protein [Microbacterium sp. ZXX196]|uniref:hypothetical protein n=1 Tax=Microbacterium sp. ZXX196 TaxID=2609291 RepID=UPI0012B7E3D6|nr:hypothetical protein [Microbacterium sp. ZXX196]MTE24461.1 hypothetical protein [Microbacterium sp. ZXX196]
MTAVDVARLEQRPSREEVAAFVARPENVEARRIVAHTRETYAVIGGSGVVAALIGLALHVWAPDEEARVIWTLIVGGPMLLATAAILRGLSSPRRAARIGEFADRNDMQFTWLSRDARFDGLPFVTGTTHRRWMAVSGKRRGRSFEVGNLSYSEGEWRRLARRCGYVAIRLPGRLPHMILDAGHGNGLLGLTLPQVPRAEQLMDIGAEKRVRLYVAPGAERIARALFAGDVRERFLALARRFDVEILGDTLFLYSRGPASGTRARRWREVLDVVDDLSRDVEAWSVWPLVRGRHARAVARMPRLAMARVRTRNIGFAVLVLVALFALIALIIAVPYIA